MNTHQLIEACAGEGVDVSVTKLAHWVRAGLIPASLRRRHGRGRGKGTEWLWQRECLARAVIIGNVLKGGDPTLYRAARALAVAGYAPSASYLRSILLEALEIVGRSMVRRQGYLTDDRPLLEKRKRLTKNMRRRAAAMPDPLIEYLATFDSALHGLIGSDDPDTQGIVGTFARNVSFPVLRRRLVDINDATLLARYDYATRYLLSYLPQFVTVFNLIVLPLLVQQARASSHPVEAIPTSFDVGAIMAGMKEDEGRVIVVPGNPAGIIRMIMTLLLAILPLDDSALLTEWETFLNDGARLLTEYLGVDWPGDFTTADQHDAQRRNGGGDGITKPQKDS
jgi:hypothetical protein